MKKLFGTLFLSLSMSLSAQVLNEKFDSKGHPKAKGVWMTVKYPSSWRAQEGDRPNIVQKFTGQFNGVQTFLIIQIKNAETDLEGECTTWSPKEWEELLTDTSAGVRASNGKKISHENKPGFLVTVENAVERAGAAGFTASRAMIICHKKNMVTAWCGTGAFGQSARMDSRKNLEILAPLCYQFFNSLVLMDQYR